MHRIPPNPSLADRVAELVRAEITGGTYNVGDGLKSEAKLAQVFGVSRTVMREAVARLKSEGFLESRQGSGVFVISTSPKASFQIEANRELELDRALEVLEFREGFEIAAAGFAARRATKADIGAMRKALAEMESAIEQQDLQRGTAADFDFHMLICEAAKNSLYPQIFETFRAFLLESLDVARENSLKRLHNSRASQVEHLAIFEAIAERNVSEAKNAAQIHLENTRTRLEEAMGGNAKSKDNNRAILKYIE